MNRELWPRIEALFHEASSVDGDSREALLQRADPTIAIEVRRLLAADKPKDLTLEHVIRGTASAWLDRADRFELQPERLGPYRILKPLGTGGMGAVFLAQRDDAAFDKLVAIKILRAGALGPEAAERFRRERQILAQLDHPYTSRLIDGGTMSDGRPYLVMEYVDGEPIHDYCRRLKLSIRQRCELILKVCEAISHAHQGLIVHRDLKPANILVDARGNPRLLDFGVAKLLNPELDRETSQIFLTPLYASPEQLRGETITTATDVYSLGAVFYELLADAPPHDTAPGRMQEPEIQPPSRRTSTAIPQDLDNIVLKAMALETTRRYRSMEQMAEDLSRYLRGEPVLARGNSLLYRSGKFARRAWLPLLALASVLITLAASAWLSGQQALEADRLRALAVEESRQATQARQESERQRQRAEQSAHESQQMSETASRRAVEARSERDKANLRSAELRQLSSRLLFEVHDGIAKLPGSTPVRKLIVQTALEQFDRIAKEGSNEAELMQKLASAYSRIGDVQGKPSEPNLGDLAGASLSYGKSLTLRKPFLAANPQLAAEQLATIASLADVERQLGQMEQSRKRILDAIEWARELPAPSPEFKIAESSLHRIHGAMLVAQVVESSYPEYESALRLLDGLPPKYRDSEPALVERILVLNSYLRALMHYTPKTAALSEEGILLAERLLKAKPLDTGHTARLMHALGVRVDLLRDGQSPKLTEAKVLIERAIPLAESLLQSDPANVQAKLDVSMVYSRLGRIEEAGKNWKEAAAAYAKSLLQVESLHRDSPGSVDYAESLASLCFQIGMVLRSMGNLEQAEAYQLRAQPLYKSVRAIDPRRIQTSMMLYAGAVQLSDIYLETKRYQQAADWLQEVIATQERYQIATRGAEGLHDAISALTSFGNCYAALAQSSGLRIQWETAIASWQKAKRIPKVGPEDLAALDRKIEAARQQLASAH